MRLIRYPVVAVACGVLTFAGVLASAQQSSSPTSSTSASPAAPPTPVQNEPVIAGPLEITPGLALLRLELHYDGNKTVPKATIRFKIRNTSASEVQVILMRQSIGATDAFGYALIPAGYNAMKSSGIMLSDLPPDRWGDVSRTDKQKFVTLSPKQGLQVELTRDTGPYEPLEFLKEHRPKTTSLQATLAVVDLSGTTTNRSFAFEEMPLTVVAGK